MGHAISAISERTSIPHDIEDPSAPAAEARRRIGDRAYNLHVQQFACAGLNYGYFYENSPLIQYDGEAAPAYTMHDYTPSTVPGCRLPHFWLPDGRSLYDALGPDFSLLRFDRRIEVDPLLTAARARRIPLKLVDVDFGESPPPYRHALVLARPDGHVGWRSQRSPATPETLLASLTGVTGPLP